jgi:hypothetical protein
MKLIEEFDEICNKIGKHVGYDGYVENHSLDTSNINNFWQSCSNDDSIYWAETKEDILEDTGDIYHSDTRGIHRGEEITLALVTSDFGDGDYWLVLDTKNEIK